MIHGEAYTLDRPLLDWITVTSFDENFRQSAIAMFSSTWGDEKRKEGVKRLQYLGESASNALGSMFYGESVQRGRWHSMIQISGELCNETDLTRPLWQAIREGWGRCTRIDLQMTTIRPDGWIQWALFNRQKLEKRPTGWIESTDKDGNAHQTVYIGQRTDGRFLRVYEKFTDRFLLRAEYECKGGMAESVARMIARGDETPATMMKLFLQTTNDKELSLLYLPILETANTAERPKVSKRPSKTAEWLLKTVLPSFTRYINEHGHNPEIPEAFARALDDAEYWQR